jgi:hypothetical protein
MSKVKSTYLLPMLALLALGALVLGVFYKQNFEPGVKFPNLGDQSESFDCGLVDRESLLVVFAVGQSIASNFGSTPYTPGPQVFSFYNGRCFPGRDPLPGADGQGGSIWSRLGDLLIQKGYAKSVLIVAVGAASSSVSDWVPGAKYYPRLVDATNSMREAGFQPGLVVWHQGSTDQKMEPQQYRNLLREFVLSFAFLGIRLGQPGRLLIATHTRCKSDAVPELQAAQASLVDHAVYIYAGPNMDTLGDELKYDRCHYNEAGLKIAAQYWLDAIEKAEVETHWLARVPVAKDIGDAIKP